MRGNLNRYLKPCRTCDHPEWSHEISPNPLRALVGRTHTWCHDLSDCACQDYQGPRDWDLFVPAAMLLFIGGPLAVLLVLSLGWLMVWLVAR